MPGGVGGVAPRGVPLSRSTAQPCRSREFRRLSPHHPICRPSSSLFAITSLISNTPTPPSAWLKRERPLIGGVLSLAGVRPLGRRLGHRQQGNRAQRFQRLQDLGCLRQESLSAGAAARRKRPSSTTPTGRSASSSAAIGTAAIGSSIWCAARVNPSASGRPSESKQLCDVESGLTSTGLLLQRGCQERGLL